MFLLCLPHWLTLVTLNQKVFVYNALDFRIHDMALCAADALSKYTMLICSLAFVPQAEGGVSETCCCWVR